LIVFLVTFKAMRGAKTFMSQANRSMRDTWSSRLLAASGTTN
jgi:hypothetical protein